MPLTGVILTKLDGDARGGAALSVRSVTGVPIRFVGIGEKSADLELFAPERMASRILGMGDVLSLIEKAEQAFDGEDAQRLARRLAKREFTLEDLRDQLAQAAAHGPAGLAARAAAQGRAAARPRRRRSVDERRVGGSRRSSTR